MGFLWLQVLPVRCIVPIHADPHRNSQPHLYHAEQNTILPLLPARATTADVPD